MARLVVVLRRLLDHAAQADEKADEDEGTQRLQPEVSSRVVATEARSWRRYERARPAGLTRRPGQRPIVVWR